MRPQTWIVSVCVNRSLNLNLELKSPKLPHKRQGGKGRTPHHCYFKVGLKGLFQSFRVKFAFSVLLETRKSLLCVQLNKITISSLKILLEGF